MRQRSRMHPERDACSRSGRRQSPLRNHRTKPPHRSDRAADSLRARYASHTGRQAARLGRPRRISESRLLVARRVHPIGNAVAQAPDSHARVFASRPATRIENSGAAGAAFERVPGVYFTPMTIESRPIRCSARVVLNPALVIQPNHRPEDLPSIARAPVAEAPEWAVPKRFLSAVPDARQVVLAG